MNRRQKPSWRRRISGVIARRSVNVALAAAKANIGISWQRSEIINGGSEMSKRNV